MVSRANTKTFETIDNFWAACGIKKIIVNFMAYTFAKINTFKASKTA